MGGLGPFERQKTKPGEHEMLGMSEERPMILDPSRLKYSQECFFRLLVTQVICAVSPQDTLKRRKYTKRWPQRI